MRSFPSISTRKQYENVPNRIARKGQGTKSLVESRGKASGRSRRSETPHQHAERAGECHQANRAKGPRDEVCLLYTSKGTKSPLDPSARLSWSRFHAPSACSFLVLRLSHCLLPKDSVKNPHNSAFRISLHAAPCSALNAAKSARPSSRVCISAFPCAILRAYR